MKIKKSRAYYQYILDVYDQRVGYYSSDDISQIVYDLLDDGETDEALAACNKGLDQHPDAEDILLMKAKVLARMQQYEESQRLLHSNPERNSPFGVSIQFAIDLHNKACSEALEDLVSQYEQQQLSAQELVDILEENFNSLEKPTLVPYLQRVVGNIEHGARRPAAEEAQTADVLGHIGALIMDCHNLREAIPVLEKALDVDAYDLFTWQDLARCQFELKMYDECQQTCEMGLAIDPINPIFNFALGCILHDQANYEEAIGHFETTRDVWEGRLKHEDVHEDPSEHDRQHTLLYELLCNAYQHTGQTDKAVTSYELLMQRAPYYQEGYQTLTMLLVNNGENEKALTWIARGLEQNPKDTTLLGMRASMNAQMRHYPEALADLEQLTDIDPTSKPYLLGKAELSRQLNRNEEADKAYRQLLKLRPRDEGTVELMRAYFESIGDDEALRLLK